MINKKQDAPHRVGNDVKGASQNNDCHSNNGELFFQPETLDGFIKSVTNEYGKVDLLLAHNMRMPLIVTLLFDDDMTHSSQRKLNKLEEEINSWLLATALRQLRQVHDYQEREKDFRKTWGKDITMIREIEDLLLVFMFIANELSPEQQRVVDAVQMATSNWWEASR